MSDSIDGLKQRLVGAFVILTLAIIFLPMIFDKPHVIGNSKIVAVPPKPDFKTVTINQARKPQFEALVEDPADKKVKLESKLNKPQVVAAVKTSSPAKVTSKPSPEKVSKSVQKKYSTPAVSTLPAFNNVWMVQLGTFGNSTNAYKLRDKLRQSGFDGHTRKVTIKGKSSIRVYSGPFVNKREAQKVKKKLDAKFNVESLVIFFEA